MNDFAVNGPAQTRTHVEALREHWRIIFAATAGWALDAFVFTILLFLIPHLGKVFDADLPAMAFVVTATGFAKVAGTIGWGFAANRSVRKVVFMAAVLWFSCAAGLSGLAWSCASFMAMRVLFGIGFGGEWTASVALLMEAVPAKVRSSHSPSSPVTRRRVDCPASRGRCHGGSSREGLDQLCMWRPDYSAGNPAGTSLAKDSAQHI